MKRRVILIIFSFIFIILGFANANTNVYAESSNVSNTVSYISRYWDDDTNEVKIVEKNCDSFNEVKSFSINWLDGWYVVTNDVTINERIIATGTINLIICDGKTLTAKKGIHLGKESTLNIYSQTNNTGTGVFTGISGTAGIGGSKLDVDGGNINIFGGIINATGGQFGAGIGGGNKGASGNVTVYGGTITAKGGSGASGIGSGNAGVGGTTIINDGVVSTTGSYPGVGVSGNLIVAENLTVLGNNDDTPSYQYDIQNDYALTRWKYMDIKYVHKHKWKYVASGETITATCDTNDCPETWGLTLTIIGGDSWYNSQYGGQANNPYIDLNINKAAFGTPTISYYKDGVEVDRCVDAGEYEARVTVGGATAIKRITIHKRTALVYAIKQAENLKYDGSSHELIEYGYNIGGELQYKLEGGEYSTDIPTAVDAGEYVVYYKAFGNSNYEDSEEKFLQITIEKADSYTITEPTAISNLVYDGSSQALITAGVASGGELQYKLGGDGEYSTDIPTAVDAGKYRVYYKVIGDSNHNDVEENVVVVNIKKADSSITTEPTAISNLVYDGTDQELINPGITSGGEILYKLGDGYFLPSTPSATDAGSYEVYYIVEGDSNHENGEINLINVTIEKADSSITTAPTAISNLIYDGSSQALITAGVASGGELQYKLESGEYSTDIPTAVEAGKYNVYYKVIGDSNHNDLEENFIVVNIKKADSSITTDPTAISNLVYDGSSQALITAGVASGGELQYKLGDGEYSTDIPTAVDAGNNNIMFKVFGTSNTDDSFEYSINVTINQATPTGYEKPSDLNAVYGDTLSSITLPSNWAWKNANELVGNVGNQEHVAVYTPTDSNYKAVEEKLNVAVTTATPTGYEKPSDLNAVYGNTLSSITLPSNWAWKNATELVGNVGNQEHIAVYTPANQNYKAVEETLNITVNTATPTGYDKPNGLKAAYGDELSSVTLPDNWSWKNTSELVGDAGGQQHTAIYTPTDQNYKAVEEKLVVSVASIMPEKPNNLEAIYGQTLANVILPEGWSWETPLDLVGEVGNQEHTAIYTSSNKNYSSTVEDLQIKVNQATPTGYEKPSDLNAVYGETLSSITLPSNWSWKNPDELVGEVGNQEHIAIYTPADSNYKAIEEMLVVSVLSSIPTDYEKPNNLAAFYGDKLSSITLPEGWSWKNPDELVGNVGNQEHIAIYTPTDSKYESVEEALIVSVMSASPDDYEKPNDLEAIYGQKLSNIVLPEGWSWEKPDELVGNVGNRTHTAIYTPTDPNYHSTSDELTIKVNQATPTDFEKPNVIEAAYGDKLSSITLPEGWSWKNPDELVGDDVNQEYIAIYTPADKNYKAVEIILTISVKGTEKGSNNGLPVGAIVGISIGSTVIASVGIFSLIWFVIKKKSLADLLAIFKKK